MTVFEMRAVANRRLLIRFHIVYSAQRAENRKFRRLLSSCRSHISRPPVVVEVPNHIVQLGGGDLHQYRVLDCGESMDRSRWKVHLVPRFQNHMLKGIHGWPASELNSTGEQSKTLFFHHMVLQ
jgi:hypothetical protein